jgi:hypothetical protein
MQAGEQASAEALLGAFKTIKASERRKHASVLNYWLSIRGDKEFPPLHDLDPLELSDAGPNSALLELISGGHDAEIRHLGEALRGGQDWPERIMDAPEASMLACIAKKLPIVAISRDFLAFEDDYSDEKGDTRIWVTLLPLSAGGAWVDYVYAFVSLESSSAKEAKAAEKPAKSQAKTETPEVEESVAEVEEPTAEIEDSVPDVEEPVAEIEDAVAEVEEPQAQADEVDEPVAEEPEAFEAEEEAPVPQKGAAKASPGFSKLFDSLAGLTGFHAQSVKVEPVAAEPEAEEPAEEIVEPDPVEDVTADEPQVDEVAEPVAEEPEAEATVDEEPEAVVAEIEDEPVAAEQPLEPADPVDETVRSEQPSGESEGPLQDKLTEVRAKADEARQAKLRANSALYEGLSAAYDFALDAEEAPEEYLRLVEAQGLKIQLRSPMKPVVKLAFAGMCDDATIKQLEAVLAWAFDQELPRGELADRIQEAGGISGVLSKAA